MERTFTTFEAARVCGVFHTTVINWVNKGQLKARVTPGGHRRIPLGVLIAFMKQYEMPVPDDLSRARRRVLVVDDDPLILRTVSRVLSRLPGKLEVDLCGNGLEALVHIGRRLPDLLVTDLSMPLLDGFQVCRVLKCGEATNAIKIVAVTGQKLDPAQRRFIGKYSDAFLRKPFTAEALAETVTALLQ
jgi:excisionase family DNA binding protein